MDESYGTFVDDEYFDNHDYVAETDDGTDDDHTDDDVGDDHDLKKDCYTAACAAPDAGAATTRPDQTLPFHSRPGLSKMRSDKIR